jgi:hypothetical protein
MTDIEDSGVTLHKNDRDVDLEWERDMIIYADRLRPENRIGAEVVFAGLSSGGTWMKHVNDDPPPCLDFADQSGFGFEGVYGTNMPTDGASFKLGTFTHYNSVTNGDLADYNPLEKVRLTITLSGGVNAALQYTITLVETVNDDDPCMFPDAPNDPPCGEKVTIASEPLQTSTIQIQRKQYTLEMVGFADCDVPGTPTNTFYTHEMAADRACLYARLIETTR